MLEHHRPGTTAAIRSVLLRDEQGLDHWLQEDGWLIPPVPTVCGRHLGEVRIWRPSGDDATSPCPDCVAARKPMDF